MAFIAYHFHWPHEQIMGLDHKERRRWCKKITQINSRVSNQQTTALEAL